VGGVLSSKVRPRARCRCCHWSVSRGLWVPNRSSTSKHRITRGPAIPARIAVELRLTPTELIEFFACAWEVATMVLPRGRRQPARRAVRRGVTAGALHPERAP
jgi:hypothetical protein